MKDNNRNSTRRTIKYVAVWLAFFRSEIGTTTDALSMAPSSPVVAAPSSIRQSNDQKHADGAMAGSSSSSCSSKDDDDGDTLQQRAMMLDAMTDVHNDEVAGGRKTFHNSFQKTIDDHSMTSSSWSDDDFIGRDVGVQNAGTDANYLPKHGTMVFESVSPVLTQEECSFIVQEARETIAQGLRMEQQQQQQQEEGDQCSNDASTDQRRPNAISNSQLGEARLSNMPRTREWLSQTLPARFYPLLRDRFGVDDPVLYDGLVLGTQAPTRSQPIHRDASLLTLNVALSCPSSDYQGGGTYLEALDEILRIRKGHLLCHAGSAMHAGNAISGGERWVLVLFLLDPRQPQLARRCHARALEHLQLQEYDQAQAVLDAGLQSIAPHHHDHLLHGTQGRLHLIRGQDRRALRSFRLADAAYPICVNALVSSATLLLKHRKPRAALRRFDRVLDRIGTRDLLPEAQMSLRARAYGARRDAARSALLCADHLYRRDELDSTTESASSSWILRHLPIAIDRMNLCLAAAPNEPTLLGMLERAEFLCRQAQTAKDGMHPRKEGNDQRRAEPTTSA